MTWEIFYTPHTDDESIGMAGAIVKARSLGHDVLVCLVTDNLPSTRGRNMFADRDIDLVQQRLMEWHHALDLLDVTERQVWGLTELDMPTHIRETRESIRTLMHTLHRTHRAVHHHAPWGMWDQNGGVGCLAHELCASAAFELSYEYPAHVSLYGIYEYSKPPLKRYAPTMQSLSPQQHEIKRKALNAYYPQPGSIGYGYTSVPELMDAAKSDPREFVIEL